jgi:prevent-host-death family protein
MSTVSLKNAKAGFSALVDEAMKGNIVTITRNGKLVAALVSLEASEATKTAMKKTRPNFGEYLMTFPGGIEFERNSSPMLDFDCE